MEEEELNQVLFEEFVDNLLQNIILELDYFDVYSLNVEKVQNVPQQQLDESIYIISRYSPLNPSLDLKEDGQSNASLEKLAQKEDLINFQLKESERQYSKSEEKPIKYQMYVNLQEESQNQSEPVQEPELLTVNLEQGDLSQQAYWKLLYDLMADQLI